MDLHSVTGRIIRSMKGLSREQKIKCLAWAAECVEAEEEGQSYEVQAEIDEPEQAPLD